MRTVLFATNLGTRRILFPVLRWFEHDHSQDRSELPVGVFRTEHSTEMGLMSRATAPGS